MRSALVAIALLGSLLVSTPVLAGGSWLATIEDSYDPGDEVTAVGYVGAAVTDEPVLARMNLVPMNSIDGQKPPVWHELGPVTIESTGLEAYLSTRVSITFTLPADVVPGVYVVDVRSESGNYIGDLLGMSVMVGVQPSEPRWIEWPLDEPLIADLPEEAIIAGPGFAVPVAELKAGRYPSNAREFTLHPDDLPSLSTSRPGLVIDDPPASSMKVDEIHREGQSAYHGWSLDIRESTPMESGSGDTHPEPVPAASNDTEIGDGTSVPGSQLVFGLLLVMVTLIVFSRRRRGHSHAEKPASEERILVHR